MKEEGREMAAWVTLICFFTTSTRCYLYTLLLLVLSSPKSSELNRAYCMPHQYEVQRTLKGSRVLGTTEWLVWL